MKLWLETTVKPIILMKSFRNMLNDIRTFLSILVETEMLVRQLTFTSFYKEQKEAISLFAREMITGVMTPESSRMSAG